MESNGSKEMEHKTYVQCLPGNSNDDVAHTHAHTRPIYIHCACVRLKAAAFCKCIKYLDWLSSWIDDSFSALSLYVLLIQVFKNITHTKLKTYLEKWISNDFSLLTRRWNDFFQKKNLLTFHEQLKRETLHFQHEMNIQLNRKYVCCCCCRFWWEFFRLNSFL